MVPVGSQKNYQDCRRQTGRKTSRERGRSKIKFSFEEKEGQIRTIHKKEMPQFR